MKMKTKRLATTVSLALGITIFAGAAFAGYSTSNGYDVGKTAFKGLLNNENYTANVDMKMLIDGEEIITSNINELYDRNGDVQLNKIQTGGSLYAGYVNSQHCVSYKQDGNYIETSTCGGKEQTSIYYNSDICNMGKGTFDLIGEQDDEEKENSNKIIRFGELIADTMIGDLKNNFVHVSSDNDLSTYEINLNSIQIPEYVNAGLSAMFSSMQIDDDQNPLNMLGSDPVVNNASLKFTVNNDGKLTDGNVSVEMTGEDDNGEQHNATIEISIAMSDYGTTKPQRVDVSTLDNVSEFNMTENGGIVSADKVDNGDSVTIYADQADNEE
jgi:hypothetical protein